MKLVFGHVAAPSGRGTSWAAVGPFSAGNPRLSRPIPALIRRSPCEDMARSWMSLLAPDDRSRLERRGRTRCNRWREVRSDSLWSAAHVASAVGLPARRRRRPEPQRSRSAPAQPRRRPSALRRLSTTPPLREHVSSICLTFHGSDRGRPAYASIIDVPSAGRWRLEIRSGQLKAQVRLRAITVSAKQRSDDQAR
jgi:hypothetical protein